MLLQHLQHKFLKRVYIAFMIVLQGRMKRFNYTTAYRRLLLKMHFIAINLFESLRIVHILQKLIKPFQIIPT